MKNKWKKIVEFVAFLLLSVFCVIKITYFFSPVDGDRQRMVGIKSEQPLDMVYVGASAASRYWCPLQAWNEAGIVSYVYGSDGVPAENLEFYIRDIRKFQDPDLFVIDARPFLYWGRGFEEVDIRRGADAMDISMNRVNMIQRYFSMRTSEERIDRLPYYFRLMKYHSDYEASFPNSERWRLHDNKTTCSYKGTIINDEHRYLEKPVCIRGNTQAELSDNCVTILMSLLEYCRSENLNVFFVVSPYYESQIDYDKANAIASLIRSFDYDFLDANDYYEEMNINFETDFGDANHVNSLGMQKYTHFLSEYIVNEYSLADKRENANYQDWNELWEDYKAQIEMADKKVLSQWCKKEEIIENARYMVSTDSAEEWMKLVRTGEYSLIVTMSGESASQKDFFKCVMSKLGICLEEIGEEKRNGFIWNAASEEILRLGSSESAREDCFVGDKGGIPDQNIASISLSEISTIVVGNRGYATLEEGMLVVIYNEQKNQVVDAVHITADDLGEQELSREKVISIEVVQGNNEKKVLVKNSSGLFASMFYKEGENIHNLYVLEDLHDIELPVNKSGEVCIYFFQDQEGQIPVGECNLVF